MNNSVYFQNIVVCNEPFTQKLISLNDVKLDFDMFEALLKGFIM